MELKRLLNDDDAVSPVIGVILMVAITVILAAVIASFVIGLGDSNQATAPSVSFSTSYDQDNNELSISVDNVGESLQASNVEVTGNFDPTSGSISGQTWDTVSGNTEISAGQQGTISNVGPAHDLSIVYNDPNNEQSFTLQEDITGPDA